MQGLVGVLIKASRLCVVLSFKGAMSCFARLEKFNLNFSSSSFAIRVNLLHP